MARLGVDTSSKTETEPERVPLCYKCSKAEIVKGKDETTVDGAEVYSSVVKGCKAQPEAGENFTDTCPVIHGRHVVIGRHKEGITLNPLEFVLDDDSAGEDVLTPPVKEFINLEDAKQYLLDHGETEESMQFYRFPYVDTLDKEEREYADDQEEDHGRTDAGPDQKN